MPMPLSSTSIHTRSPVCPADSTIRPPSGVYLMALDTMFIITCMIRSRSARTWGRCSGRRSSTVWAWFWASIKTAW